MPLQNVSYVVPPVIKTFQHFNSELMNMGATWFNALQLVVQNNKKFYCLPVTLDVS